jgi:alpha-beta hydrolase superfamily lysophospholipase
MRRSERLIPDEGRLAELPATDGYRLTYRVWHDGAARARATLVLFNGIMSHSLWFHPLVGPLLAAGFKIVGADRRGTGENDVARGDAPSAKVLLDDAAAIIAAERVPATPIYLIGWCWGAVLGINVAAALRPPPAGLALLAPGLFPTPELTRRMAEQERAARESPRDRPCLESPIDEEMFTAGPALADFIVPDRRRTAHFTPRFLEIMGRLALGARMSLPKLDLPMLLVLASDDAATDNQATESGLARLTSGRVAARYLTGAHGLQFDAPAELARTIIDWVAKVEGIEGGAA